MTKLNLLKPSGYPLEIKFGMPFAEYITIAKNIVTKTRQDLTEDNQAKIIQANSPFEFIPKTACRKAKIGILCVHGLFDSPLNLQDIAQHFANNNFYVRGLLLPGHGTVPGDLITVNYQQWLATVLYGINSFKGLVDQIYLVGFSTGALLSIYHVLNGIKIDGLILLSPGLSAKYQFTRLAGLYRKAIKWWPQLEWLRVGNNTDYARYESFPLNAVDQFYGLSLATAKLYQSKLIDVPIFMALSTDDYIINAKAATVWLSKQTNPNNKLIIYTNKNNNHISTQIKSVTSAYVNLKIKNFSHVCIPIAPNNSHYGMQGDYLNFQTAEERKRSNHLFAGSKNLYFPNHSKMLNLSYNPDFAGLIQELDEFINKVAI